MHDEIGVGTLDNGARAASRQPPHHGSEFRIHRVLRHVAWACEGELFDRKRGGGGGILEVHTVNGKRRGKFVETILERWPSRIKLNHVITELRLNWTEDVVVLHPVGPNCRLKLRHVGPLRCPYQESAVGSRGLVITLLCLSLETCAALQSGNKVVRLVLGGGPGRIGRFKVACSVRIIVWAVEDVTDLNLRSICLWNGSRDVADLALFDWASE